MCKRAGHGSFPAGSFDSLSAVELSSSLSDTLGVQLPGTLVFDYPSVHAMAKFIHNLLQSNRRALVQAGSADLNHSDQTKSAMSLKSKPHVPAAVPSDRPDRQLTTFSMATRLPTNRNTCTLKGAAGACDGITIVPFARWDIEVPFRVSPLLLFLRVATLRNIAIC